MQIRPKYQVFISSTYGDLRSEREAVTCAVLSTRHIPAGMESFSATDDRGWLTIKSVIDRSDYYILILAGRYGSVANDGVSWTEKEYRYATEIGVPVLAFIRTRSSTTADMIDVEPETVAKLHQFTAAVRDRHLCQEWSTKEELVSKVSHALRNHIDDDEDNGNSRPGWYRGDQLPGPETLEEFARLSAENSRLQSKLESIEHANDYTARFELVDRADRVLELDESETRALKIYHPACTSIEELTTESYASLYLTLNILSILELGIRNVGRTLVKNVTIDLELKPILGFRCGWDGKILMENGGRLNNSTVVEAYRRKYPEFAELLEQDRVKLRFRFPDVAVGGTEYLPDILVLGVPDQHHSEFTVSYKVAGSEGAPTEGSLRRTILFEGTQKVEEEERAREERKLRKERDLIIIDSMLFSKAPR